MTDPARIAGSKPEQSAPVEPVHAVGIGPGSTAYLTRRVTELLGRADVVLGFETVTDRIAEETDAKILPCQYDNQTDVIERFGERVGDGERGVAVFWGDPNVSGYQLLGRVEAAVDGAVRVVPGVSSVQIAAARCRTPIEKTTIASLHQRGSVTAVFSRLAAAEDNHLLVLVRPYDWMPPAIAAELIDRGLSPDRDALVLEELTLPEESIQRTTLGELAPAEDRSYSDRSILVVRASKGG